MSEAPNDQQLLIQYLLGLLPEADTERIDELAIADDEWAAKISTAEDELIDAYVCQQLKADYLERFRNHYLASPLRREKVKFAMAFREAIEAQPGTASPNTSRPGKSNWLLGMFQRPAFRWSFATAALVILVVAVWLGVENIQLRRQTAASQEKQNELVQREQDLRSQLEDQRNKADRTEQELAQLRSQQQAQTEPPKSQLNLIATLFLTPQLRGSGGLPTVKIEPTTKSIAAHLTLEPNDFSSYRVSLVEEGSHQVLWTSSTLRAKATEDNKSVSVSMRAELFKSQDYLLRVVGVSANGASEPISDYPFRVVK